MQEQTKSPAQRALDALNEAFAYYTPTPRPASTAPVYDDMPFAA
ncbi:hypothetical protein GGQ68_002336 [Sagittula marina]|uniref:Uncharacterized protein n=1 Tax=Sagittula marina TaxID=943940 RepID=A0A7W6GSW8_9RHOB|nr:hypothetical protein [Sagittula marina]